MMSILTGVSWYLIVVLICISLINSVEHCFMWLLAIYISSVKKALFRYSSHFFIRLFFFFFWCWAVLYFLKIISLLATSFAKKGQVLKNENPYASRSPFLSTKGYFFSYFYHIHFSENLLWLEYCQCVCTFLFFCFFNIQVHKFLSP